MVSTDRLSRRSVASLLFIAAGAMVSQGFGRFTYPVLLDAIDDDVLHSYERAGLLGTIGVLAYLLGTALMSYASTRAEPVSLVRAGLSLSLICLVLMAIAPGFAILAVGSFLGGLGGAGAWIPSPGLGAAAVGPQRAGLAIGLVGAGIGSGIVVAGPLTNLVRSLSGDEGAWRPVYVIEALIAVVVLAGVLFVVRLPATGTSAERIPVSVIRRVPGWKLLLAAFGLFGFAYSLYFYFLVAQLKEDGWSSSARNWIFTLLGVASVAGGIIFGRISDSHGRPLTMAVGFALLTVSPLLTLSGVAPLVIAAAVSFGLCVSGTPTAIGAVVADHLSGRSFGAAFGTLTLTFSTAQVLGPYFAGKMADLTGDFTVPFLVASAVGVAGAVCALAMRRAAPLALAMPPDAEAGAAIRPR